MTTNREPDFPTALLQISESLEPVLDLASSFKAKAEEAGFSPAVAEQIAADTYQVVVKKIFNPKS